MVGATADGNGFSGLVFNYVVRSEKRVNEVMDEAKKAGAKILKPAAKLQWGGYGGALPGPDCQIRGDRDHQEGKEATYPPDATLPHAAHPPRAGTRQLDPE